MIFINNETIGGVPTLHVVDREKEQAKLPTIFFLHGFTSAKEHNLHIAYMLATKGFRVLLPDAIYHGERQKTEQNRDLKFWEIVLTSIHELELLKEYMVTNELGNDQIGVIGTSMGAITMYGALARYPWITSAVSFMGTAYYQVFLEEQLKMLETKGVDLHDLRHQVLHQIKPYDLTVQLERLNGRPLMIWHGKEDQVVPYPFSEKLYGELEKYYEEHPHRLKFVAEDRVDHKVSRQAVLSSVEWFEQHLLKDQIS
ncbi:esterase [Halalkalibacter hemicellulosilyticus]|uniref:Putative hydrolase of the alpha/beta superfamily n=1 Tax=Halalkalibacter hemicellulosilyticusJCM 9152 TaxID=1236971 RepID=W4QIL7_9BACI|nr:esterase [Halalkalibacter hemicellulosilyticus]GAE31194.1 putative hydrolase of the alpha/beta superfamily [Halalkalibacter hemicellulosilyticusJCM 9152]